MSQEAEQKTRILLADGHHMVRQGIRRLLDSEADFKVVGETANGLEVVKLAREIKPDIIASNSCQIVRNSSHVLPHIFAGTPDVIWQMPGGKQVP